LGQRCAQRRADPAELVFVRRGEPVEQLFATRRQSDHDAPAVFRRVFAADELQPFEAVEEFDGAVVADLQSLGQFADRDGIASGESFDGEQGLMLLRGEPCAPGGIFAEPKELAQRVSERRQVFVL